MPHAVLNSGTQTADGVFDFRGLVPGVEPGGSRAGQPFKPALLIQDMWISLTAISTDTGLGDGQIRAFLKLSQEIGMNPGLRILIEELMVTQASGVADAMTGVTRKKFDYWQGRVYAPRFVALDVDIRGNIDEFALGLHIDYQRIDVPWLEWFIMWEFLDGVTDSSVEF